MVKGFWGNIKKPIMAQAPMADVTDVAFRRVIARYGKPDVMWTEFVSVEGLMHPIGRERLMQDLAYDLNERPIVAQVFGADPSKFYEVAKLCNQLGFDGIDINMGCPVRVINKQGAGADLINDGNLAVAIIEATKQGAEEGDRPIPVSVKTRVGFNTPCVSAWIPKLLSAEPAALIIHGRTAKEMSKVTCPWGRIKEAREIRDRIGSSTLLLGNGDVRNLSEAEMRVKESGVDGVMIGRGLFGNPWIFNREHPRETIPFSERMGVLLEHTRLYDELISPHKSFAVMRKHFKSYTEGYHDAKNLRLELMEAENADDVEGILRRFALIS